MAIPSNVLEIRYSYIYNRFVSDDIKIASLSDVHISDAIKTNDIDFMIDSIKKEKPNYICTLGDIVDYPNILDKEINRLKCERLFMGLSKIAPVYVVMGNHDYIDYDTGNKHDENYKEEFWNKINNIKNINIVNDKKIVLKDLIIGGYLEKRKSYHDKEKEFFYEDFTNSNMIVNNNTKPKILLMHSPEPLDYNKNIDLVSCYDVILCGHYHNGCVPSILNKIWLPKNGGVITPSKRLFPKNVRGIRILKGDTYLIYNGGWTKIPDNTPDIFHVLDKMCNRQIDITILTNKYKKLEVKTKKIKKN